MKTELWYLLDELDNWDNSRVITIKDLREMINKSMNKAGEDAEEIENSRSIEDL